jgi:hypothetical protein
VTPLDSSTFEEIEATVPGSRYFTVRVRDPGSGLVIRGLIAIAPADLADFEGRCPTLGVDFEAVLPGIAAYEVLHRIWGPRPSWPAGYEVLEISESSLDGVVSAEMARRASSD